MKAIIRTKGGKHFSGMKVMNIKPAPLNENQIRVKMTSSRINPVDHDLMSGMPFLKYKKLQIGGIDGAGRVIELGSGVNNFQVGDAVFFYRKFNDIGAWAEEIVVNAVDVANVPANISVEDAGSIALPLLTAYDALQQLGAQKGERILIHGAGGGVGFQAVQLAKQMGLHVITNSSKRDFGKLEALGVDQRIDYKTQAFEAELRKDGVDYIFDVIGKDTLLKSIALQPKKVISVAYAETEKMHKTGLQFPGIIRFVLKLSMRKFRKAAQRQQVELIGQVTGADGALLQQASDRISQMNYVVNPYQSLNLQAIEQNGLSKTDVGKVILF